MKVHEVYCTFIDMQYNKTLIYMGPYPSPTSSIETSGKGTYDGSS